MIDLQQVTKTYAKNNKKAVDNLTLHVDGGSDLSARTAPARPPRSR